MRTPHYFDIHPESLTSSDIRNPCFFLMLFWAQPFSICSVGALFCWVAPVELEGSECFYWGTGRGTVRRGGEAGARPATPGVVLGPNVHLGAAAGAADAGAPQVTKFREVSDFYGGNWIKDQLHSHLRGTAQL